MLQSRKGMKLQRLLCHLQTKFCNSIKINFDFKDVVFNVSVRALGLPSPLLEVKYIDTLAW